MRTAEDLRWEVAPDPMHAAERAQTLRTIAQMESMLAMLSAGADSVLGSRVDFSDYVESVGLALERARDEVLGR